MSEYGVDQLKPGSHWSLLQECGLFDERNLARPKPQVLAEQARPKQESRPHGGGTIFL